MLASITRGRLLRLLQVREQSVTRNELLGAREAFLASTTREVQPIVAIEQWVLPATGPVTSIAAKVLRAEIATELGWQEAAPP